MARIAKYSLIMQQDPRKMNNKELRQAVQTLGKEANKRYKDFVAGEMSPAARGLHDSGGKITTRGIPQKGSQTRKALMKEFRRARDFLNAPTSRKKQWDKTRKTTIDTINTRYNLDMKQSDFDDMWKTYEKLREIDPAIENRNYRYAVIERMNELRNPTGKRKGKPYSWRYVFQTLKKELETLYQESIETRPSSIFRTRGNRKRKR